MSRDRVVSWLIDLGVPAVTVANLLAESYGQGFSQFAETPIGRVCIAQVPNVSGDRSTDYQVSFK